MTFLEILEKYARKNTRIFQLEFTSILTFAFILISTTIDKTRQRQETSFFMVHFVRSLGLFSITEYYNPFSTLTEAMINLCFNRKWIVSIDIRIKTELPFPVYLFCLILCTNLFLSVLVNL